MVVIKVTNIDRSKKVGIVAKDLKEFHAKVMKKYNMNNKLIMKDVTYHLSSDGVIIDSDEYFQTLEPQTSIIMVLKEQKNAIRTDFDLLMENIRLWQKDYLKTGQNVKFFIDENNEKIFSVICKALKINETQALNAYNKGGGDVEITDKHQDDKYWFEGIDTNAKNKETYMFKKAQDRFRSYFYKTKDDLYHSVEYREDKIAKIEIDLLIDNFKKWLGVYSFLGHIFDRSKFNYKDNLENDQNGYVKINKNDNVKNLVNLGSSIKNINNTKRIKLDIKKENHDPSILESYLSFLPIKQNSICDSMGLFSCEGAWNKEVCVYKDHAINPYVSREHRILFQTWNLDHQVEKSRTVIPSILKNARLLSEKKAKCIVHSDRPAVHLSQVIYFLELFTMANLRLVHIVCHDKKSHELQSSGGGLCLECHEREKQQMEL